MMDLSGRTAIVTGGTQGLGLEIVKTLKKDGADVLFCARTEKDIEACEKETGAAGIRADVASEDDCRLVAEKCISEFGKISILVNNAGIHGAKGPIDEIDMAEFKKAIDVDLYGPVNMIRSVLPSMKQQAYGKIINISGGGSTSARPYFDAYSAAKAAIVRLTENLALEFSDHHIDINAVSPGAMNTRLADDIISAGSRVGREAEQALKRKQNGATPPAVPAALVEYLASAASDGISGRIISAVWDDWEGLAAHREELKSSDAFTLRRILPKERGFAWGEK